MSGIDDPHLALALARQELAQYGKAEPDEATEAALREAAVQAELNAQRDKVARIQATNRELLHSPQGLMALFPTNRISLRLTTTTKKRAEALARKEARK